MNILVLSELQFDIISDINKASQFFDDHLPFHVSFTVKPILLHKPSLYVFKTGQGFSPITGQPAPVKYYGLSDSVRNDCRKVVLDNQYDMVILMWNVDQFPKVTDGTVTSFSFSEPLYQNTEFIQVCANPYLQGQDKIWKTVTHEMMHALVKIYQRKGAQIFDPMDSYKKENDYLENDNPYSLTGNYAECFRRLKPFMQTVTITREQGEKETVGTLIAQNAGATFSCKTLELPWKNNQKSVSCIPTGTYQVTWAWSPRKMKRTYRVLNVPNRDGVLFHSVNFVRDLKGCIGLGSGYVDIDKDGLVDIINSRKTVSLFEQFMGKKDFTLVVQ